MSRNFLLRPFIHAPFLFSFRYCRHIVIIFVILKPEFLRAPVIQIKKEKLQNASHQSRRDDTDDQIRYGNRDIESEDSENLQNQIDENTAIGYDLIVPVPASGKRRGYNVPELMALPLAKSMEVPLAPQALERTRAKRHQAGLPLEQRIANVAGAFRAAQPQQLEGKRILLVDDVITTGTTAAACAQALLHAGADSVFALAFATVEFGAPPDDTTPIHEDPHQRLRRTSRHRAA